MYQFLIDGRRYRIEGADIGLQLERVISAVQNRLLAALDARRRFRHRHGVIGAISDVLGVATMPSDSNLQEGRKACVQARAALARRDYPAVKNAIDAALVFYDVARSQWYRYIDGTVSGADRARTGLAVTSAVAIGVSTTVLSGGIAAQAGAGAVATAAIGAGISANTAAVTQLAVEATENFVSVDPEVNWRRMAEQITASAVSGFVSSLVGGWLRPYVAEIFAVTCPAEALRVANEELAAAGARTIAREVVQTTLRRVATRVITSIHQSILAEVASATVIIVGRAVLQSGRKPLREFLTDYIRALGARDAGRVLGRAIGQAILGGRPIPVVGLTPAMTRFD